MRLSNTFLLTLFLIGCAVKPTYIKNYTYIQYLETKNFAPGFEPERKYVEKISKKLIECMKTNDPLESYWDKVILIPLETYINFDDTWMKYLEQKSEEYKYIVLPKCKDILYAGFINLNKIPEQKTFPLQRAELILLSIKTIHGQEILPEIIIKLDSVFQDFFNPIYTRMKNESMDNKENLDRTLESKVNFWQYYSLLQKYASQEYAKLTLRDELDRVFSPVIDEKRKKWLKSITDEQKNIFVSQNAILAANPKSEISALKFLSSLTPFQFSELEREVYLRGYIEDERSIGKERVLKLHQLFAWLKNYQNMAQASYNTYINEEKLRAARAQAFGALLLGISSSMNAYNNWQRSYYNAYILSGQNRNVQLFDQFGNYYFGTIK